MVNKWLFGKTKKNSFDFKRTGGVGKSCLTLQFVCNKWVNEGSYEPTIEDVWQKKENVDGQVYNICVIDSAGQEEYRTLVAESIRDCDAVIVVYDVTSTSSFSNVEGLESHEFK